MSSDRLRRSASTEISASPNTVYDTVRRLDQMGEWSPENMGGRWLVGDGSSVGDRFEGDNKRGDRTWTFPVVINTAEAGNMFAFQAVDGDTPLVQWTYEMTPSEGGTILTETWELLQPKVFVKIMGEDFPTQRAAVIEADLATTLANLKSSIESEAR